MGWLTVGESVRPTCRHWQDMVYDEGVRVRVLDGVVDSLAADGTREAEPLEVGVVALLRGGVCACHDGPPSQTRV